MRPSKSTSKSRGNETVSVLRFRLEPTKEQEQKLFRTFFLCRKLYNQALEDRVMSYREKGITIHYTDQQNRLPVWKREHPEYQEVHSQVLQNVLQRLDQAFVNFFEKRAKFPKFKTNSCFDPSPIRKQETPIFMTTRYISRKLAGLE